MNTLESASTRLPSLSYLSSTRPDLFFLFAHSRSTSSPFRSSRRSTARPSSARGSTPSTLSPPPSKSRMCPIPARGVLEAVAGRGKKGVGSGRRAGWGAEQREGAFFLVFSFWGFKVFGIGLRLSIEMETGFLSPSRFCSRQRGSGNRHFFATRCRSSLLPSHSTPPWRDQRASLQL